MEHSVRYVGGGHGWVYTSPKGFKYYNFESESDAISFAESVRQGIDSPVAK